MTLDIPQFITNSIRTQSKIHHLDINVKACKTSDIPESVTSLVYKDYGEKYLDDAEYVAFFWGGLNKDNIDKLFNVVDKALGKSANKLTDKDFKKLKLDDSEADDDLDDNDEEDIESADDEDEELSDDNDSISDGSAEEDEEEDTDDEDAEAGDAEEKDDEEQLDEDEDQSIGDAVEEKPSIPTAYFFLKITTK